MDNFTFSDQLLDLAFYMLAYEKCKSETEKKQLSLMQEVCKKHGVSLRKHLEVITELNNRMSEMEAYDD